MSPGGTCLSVACFLALLLSATELTAQSTTQPSQERGQPVARTDTLAIVARDLSGLPGETSMAVATLDGPSPTFGISHEAEQPLAVASAFKLFILAELARSVQAGERKWTDVVPLDRQSIPTGILQRWPKSSPMTVHTLAGLMISVSDNSASDTLLHLLGREKVEAMLRKIGVRDPARLRPLLDTREAALIKAGRDGTLRSRWATAREAERRAILRELANTPAADIDIRTLSSAPIAIESVEWFASTADLVRVLNWLRLHGGKETVDLLAINPGPPREPGEFGFLGYKGGSETGVINMNFLIRSKNGGWRAVSMTWNDPAKAIDETRFLALINRVLTLLR